MTKQLSFLQKNWHNSDTKRIRRCVGKHTCT